jgi:hypothetical protein
MKKFSLAASAADTKVSRVGRLLAVAAVTAAMSLAVAGAASAGPVVGTFTTNTLAANDDGSTGSVALPFTANFFGTNYTSLFVNNNGNVTFGSALAVFTPLGVAGGYSGAPIISPFFADVDTRGAASGLVTYGAGVYDGHTAFGVEWPHVGYYEVASDKLNTFELILTDRADTGAGNFDIFFNYNQIKWETGNASDGVGGLGGKSAAVGFSNGTGAPGTFFQFNGSLTPGAFLDGGPNSLVAGTNNNLAGQYLFQVRNGGVVVPPIGDGAIPEPTTWAMMIMGMGGVGALIRRRRNAAQPATA